MSSRYRTVDCDERKITWDQRDKVIDESANLDFPASAHFTFTTHFRLCRSESWERTETYEFEFHVSGREGRRNEKPLDLSDLANYRSNFFSENLTIKVLSLLFRHSCLLIPYLVSLPTQVQLLHRHGKPSSLDFSCLRNDAHDFAPFLVATCRIQVLGTLLSSLSELKVSRLTDEYHAQLVIRRLAQEQNLSHAE